MHDGATRCDHLMLANIAIALLFGDRGAHFVLVAIDIALARSSSLNPNITIRKQHAADRLFCTRKCGLSICGC
jgi:hypothetical protein